MQNRPLHCRCAYERTPEHGGEGRIFLRESINHNILLSRQRELTVAAVKPVAPVARRMSLSDLWPSSGVDTSTRKVEDGHDIDSRLAVTEIDHCCIFLREGGEVILGSDDERN